MKYLLTIYTDESASADVPPEPSAEMMAAYRRVRGGGGRRDRRRRGPAAGRDRDDRARARRRAAADRRAVRRDARAARRLLPGRRATTSTRRSAGPRRSRARRAAASRCARSWSTRHRAPRLAAGEAAARRLSATPADVLDRLFRRESGQAVAALARALGDLDRAEEAVQDAFAIALERWPRDGVPANPAAWIVTVARNRAIDRIRADRRARAAPRRSRGWTRSAAPADPSTRP